ncbi:hypothetical protein CON64_10815 [Bacillus pseudomycoides]|nr:hypothetical protein CON64_10815 [Bacillus pseudomycoides]
MFDGLSLETISKIPPALITFLTTLLSLLIGALLYGINQFIKVTTTDKIDTLFIDKPTQIKVKFWYYLMGTIIFYMLYVASFIFLGSNFYDYLFHENIKFKNQIAGLNGVFFLSVLIILLVWGARETLKKNKFKIGIIVFNILTSIIFIFLFFSEEFSHSTTSNSSNLIYYIIFMPSILGFFYVYILNKILHPYQKYSIKILTDEEMETKAIKEDFTKLIHGYAIDEKRTVCFIEGESQNEVFYLCDFSSKVYVKYTKQTETHVNITNDKTQITKNTDTSIIDNEKQTKEA